MSSQSQCSASASEVDGAQDTLEEDVCVYVESRMTQILVVMRTKY